MKFRYIWLCLLPLVANAGETLFVPNPTTSKILPCIYTYDVDGTPTTLGLIVQTAVDFDSSGLTITFEADDASETGFSYTQAGGTIIDVDTPGTWQDPSTDELGFDIDAGGCINLHVRDEVLGVSGAQHLAVKIDDGGTLIADKVFTIYQGLATASVISDLIDSRLTDFPVASQDTLDAVEAKIDILDGAADGTATSLSGIEGVLGTPTDFGSGATLSDNLVDVNAKIDIVDDFLDTEVAAILEDTNELQIDDVPGLISGLNNLSQANVRTAVGLGSANLDTQLDLLKGAFLNCEVNTANFAGSSTTFACILTDLSAGAVTQATGDLEGLLAVVTSGDQIREQRYINDTTWDAGNSELQITISRALPGTLADAVTVVIK